jgi:predicted transcriptional regulator
MKSYMTILTESCEAHNISLKRAFIYAGVRDSTFYRAKNGRDLRFDTAVKVAKAIEKLSAQQG